MFAIIDQVIRNNMLHRFQSELEYSDDVQTIQTIIQTLGQQKYSHEIKQEKLNSHVAILKEKPYQKKWQYLTDEQKVDRLKIYLESSELSEQEKKIYSDHFEKNGFLSKEVQYNNQTARIEMIRLKEDKRKRIKKKYTDGKKTLRIIKNK